MFGRTSGLNRGNRKGCDHNISSDSGDTTARELVVEGGPEANENMELMALLLSACKEVVRFEVKEDLGFGVVALLTGVGKNRSSSASLIGNGTNGWSRAQSWPAGKDRGISFFLRLLLDLRLRRDGGVEGLVRDRTDLSSALREGIESLDVDRECRYSASGALLLPGVICSSSSSASSRSTLREGLLLRLGFSVSSVFHSLTSSSIEIRRFSLDRRRNWLGRGRGIVVTASSAATAGGIEPERWFSGIDCFRLLPFTGLLLTAGMLIGLRGTLRSGSGTATGFDLITAGSDDIRTGDLGLVTATVGALFSGRGRLPFRTVRRPFFSSNSSFGGEAPYLNGDDLGATNISATSSLVVRHQWRMLVKSHL